jgi:EAL domain-containing protein (putative c-di-GMP-specific phosphodiesterase class I)
LRHCPPDKAREIADDLLGVLLTFRFVWQANAFKIGASIGIAVIERHAESVQSVLSLADAACYLAKEKGRGRVQLSMPDDAELLVRQGEMHWVTRIQHALAEDRLVLYSQPIFPIAAGSPGRPHQEVLVRMIDENGELVPPSAFIPAAERYGVMHDVDRWVIDRTFQLIARCDALWPAQDDGVYAVNISGDTLAAEGTLDYIRERLDAHRIDPGRICFEVTETAAIANLASALDLMQVLKQAGCRFALDDFGSGLSSFGYLKALPVDYLKIDGAFVRNLDQEPMDRVMVQAINSVGHAMGLKTIAECVESEAVLRELELIGVDYAQGFGLGRPEAFEQGQCHRPEGGKAAG